MKVETLREKLDAAYNSGGGMDVFIDRVCEWDVFGIKLHMPPNTYDRTHRLLQRSMDSTLLELWARFIVESAPEEVEEALMNAPEEYCSEDSWCNCSACTEAREYQADCAYDRVRDDELTGD